MIKYIERLKDIDGVGQYRCKKHKEAPPITVDTELNDDDSEVYVVCIAGMWLMSGWNIRTFKTIGGARRHLQQLAVEGVGRMGWWIDSRYSGQNISGSAYRRVDK